MTETELKRDICKLLDTLGIYWVRLQASGYRGRMKGCPKGTADLLAAPYARRQANPVWLWLEIKKPGEKQTPEQIQFQNNVEGRGMTYIVARSMDDVLSTLRAL